jgi:predicted SprT family Zn-dependent metalloprotease
MNIVDATEMFAIKLMNDHNLIEKGWRFEFDNSRRRAGVCKFGRRIIGLSKYLLPHMNSEMIKNTILHEIAHALVGPEHGHDWVWQQKAIEIGCDGKRCYNAEKELANYEETLAVQSKYTLSCPTCGKKTPMHRSPKRDRSCGKCSNGVYNPQHKLIVTQNY